MSPVEAEPRFPSQDMRRGLKRARLTRVYRGHGSEAWAAGSPSRRVETSIRVCNGVGQYSERGSEQQSIGVCEWHHFRDLRSLSKGVLMRKSTLISSTLIGALALSPLTGCENLPGSEKEQGAVIGGAGGAAAGAAL